MSSCTDIRVPHETVNDDVVTIVQWHIEPNAPVQRGRVLASIETSKAVLEVQAEADGYVQILKAAGSEVAVNEVIGRIQAERSANPTDDAPEYDAVAVAVPTAPANASQGASNGPSGATLSRKAQALIEQYGIDPNAFAGQGLVREAQVIEFLEARPKPDAAKSAKDAAPDARTATTTGRSLLQDAAVSASERGQSVFRVGLNYVFRNWLLGNLVRWAPRGVILPLHRLRGVKMGAGCFIDPSAIVETAYPQNVRLGDDVRITAGAVIMTHIKAPHYLRETGIMPPVVKPVVLEDHCFIGVNAVVMPGVTVGAASVVASGAVAVNNVPPYTMVSGNPAKVIKRFPKPPQSD